MAIGDAARAAGTAPGKIGRHGGQFSQAAGEDAAVHARGAPRAAGIPRRRAGHVPADQERRRPGELPVGGRRGHRRGTPGRRPEGARRRRREPAAGGARAAGAGQGDRRGHRGLRDRRAARPRGLRAVRAGVRGPARRPRRQAAAGGHAHPGARPAAGPDGAQGRLRARGPRCGSPTSKPATTRSSRGKTASPSASRSSSPPRRWAAPAATGGRPTAPGCSSRG